MVTLSSGNIQYFYDATGVKQKKIVSTGTTTEYAGNYVYENGSLKFFNHPEGYVEPDGSGGYDYVYQYKDHLGNIRLSYKNDDTVTPVNIDDDFNSGTDGWSTPGSGSINNSNQKLNISISTKWNKSGKYLTITPNVPLHIEFDFENGNMVLPVFYVHERINGVWEPGGNRDQIPDIQDGHHTMDLNLTGDYIWIYFEKGSSTDDGTSTTCYVDNFKLTQNGLEILEENNYYPFGLKHKGYNDNPTSSNIALKRKFGGKEFQDELGLDWYDISARNYDPALGRWMNLDPLAEMMRRHSPYNYAFDNPVYFIDADGMAPEGFGGIVNWNNHPTTDDDKNQEEEKENNYCPECDNIKIILDFVKATAIKSGEEQAKADAQEAHNPYESASFYTQTSYIGPQTKITGSDRLAYKEGIKNLRKYVFAGTLDLNRYEFSQDFEITDLDGKVHNLSADATIYLQPNPEDMNLNYMGLGQSGTGMGETVNILKFYNADKTLIADLKFRSKDELDAFIFQYYRKPQRKARNEYAKKIINEKKQE